MGYYTSFNFSVEPFDNGEIIGDFRQSSDGAKMALDYIGQSSQETKWYDCEKDLKDFSKNYPDLLFKLEGEGEETLDRWILYVKNGKTQMCKAIVTYAEYDESKLE